MVVLHLPLEQILRSSLHSDDPFHAEAAVSAFLGQLWGADGTGAGFPTMNIDAFIGDLATRAAPESTAALVLLAHLASAESSRDLAIRLLAEQSPPAPRPGRVDAIGALSAGPVMVFADGYGDQARLALEFTGAHGSHVLRALVDYSHLGAWCPDPFLVQDAEVLRPMMAKEVRTRRGAVRLNPLDPAAAVFLIRRATQATDLTHEPNVAGSYNETRALALASAPAPAAGSKRGYPGRRRHRRRPVADADDPSPSARRCERPGCTHRRRPLVIEAWVEFAIGLSGLTPEAVSELRAALPDLNAMSLADYVD